MKLPKRKSTRIPWYDYSQDGAYFVTVCTNKRKELLSHVTFSEDGIEANNELTEIGKEIHNSIEFINNQSTIAKIDKFIVMPNHIHLIVLIDSTVGGKKTALTNVVQQLKSHVSHKFSKTIWQRSFHDHIIRNEKDYEKIWDYIENNAYRWKNDCFYIPENE